MYSRLLPQGAAVRVVEGIHQSDASYKAETAGVIEAWDEEPAGAWFANGRNRKLWLKRLKLRKADGELSVLTIDDQAEIHVIAASEVRNDEPTSQPPEANRVHGVPRSGKAPSSHSQRRKVPELARVT